MSCLGIKKIFPKLDLETQNTHTHTRLLFVLQIFIFIMSKAYLQTHCLKDNRHFKCQPGRSIESCKSEEFKKNEGWGVLSD